MSQDQEWDDFYAQLELANMEDAPEGMKQQAWKDADTIVQTRPDLKDAFKRASQIYCLSRLAEANNNSLTMSGVSTSTMDQDGVSQVTVDSKAPTESTGK